MIGDNVNFRYCECGSQLKTKEEYRTEKCTDCNDYCDCGNYLKTDEERDMKICQDCR